MLFAVINIFSSRSGGSYIMLLTTCGFYELRSFRPVSWHSSRDQPCLRQRKVPGYYELSVQLTFQSLSTHMMFTLERLAHKAFFLRFGMSSECPALHCLCSCAKGILPPVRREYFHKDSQICGCYCTLNQLAFSLYCQYLLKCPSSLS